MKNLLGVMSVPLFLFLSSHPLYAHDVGERIETECSQVYIEVYDKPYSNVTFAFSIANLSSHLELGDSGMINVVAETKSDSGKTFKHAGNFGYTYDGGNGIAFPLYPHSPPLLQAKIGDEGSKGVEFKEEFGNFPNVTCYFLK